MGGFGSVAATQAAVSGSGTTSVSSGTNMLQANVLSGTVILTWAAMYKAAGTPPSVTGVTHGFVATTTPVKLLHYDDGFGRVEVWWARATANATGNVTSTVTFSGTSDSSNQISVRPWSGFPASWEIRNSGTYTRSTNATLHPCGTVTAEADDLIITASVLTNTIGTTTSVGGFTGWAIFSWSYAQYLKTTSGITTDAGWGGNNRGTTGMAIVLTESGGVATMQPRVMFVL